MIYAAAIIGLTATVAPFVIVMLWNRGDDDEDRRRMEFMQ